MIKETKPPFLCRDAFKLLPDGPNLLNNMYNPEKLANTTFLKFLDNNADEFLDVKKLIKFRLVVLQKQKNWNYVLWFDGRHFLEVDNNLPLICWILDDNGNLLEQKFDIRDLPKLHNQMYRHHQPEEPLWQLMGLSQEEPNPTNYEETVEFVKKHNKEDYVSIFFSYQPKTRNYGEKWVYLDTNHTKIELVSFTKKDYSIGFRKERVVLKSKKKKPEIKIEEIIQQLVPDVRQVNRTSAVSVRCSGLNLALNLGCVTIEELKKMSIRLASTAGSLWIEVDNENKARYITYSDYQKNHPTGNQKFGFMDQII